MTVNGTDRNYPYFQPLQDTIAPLGSYYNSFTNTRTNPAIFSNTGKPLMDTFQFGSTNPGVYTYTSAPAENRRSTSDCIDYFEIKRRRIQEQEQRRIEENLANTKRIGGSTTDAEERAVRDSINTCMREQREQAYAEIDEANEDMAISTVAMTTASMAGFTLVSELPEWHRHWTSKFSGSAYSNVSKDVLSSVSGSSRREITRALNDSRRALEHLERGLRNGRVSSEVFRRTHSAHSQAVQALMNSPADKAALDTLKNITNVTREAAGPGAYSRALSFWKKTPSVSPKTMIDNLNAAKVTASTTSQVASGAAQTATTVSRTASTLSKVGNFMKSGVKACGGKLGTGIMAVATLATEGFSVYSAFQQSKEEGWKQVGRSTLNAIGSIGGYIAGAALGAKIGMSIGGVCGTVIPGLGNVVGVALGAVVGAVAGLAFGWAGKKIFGDPAKQQAEKSTQGIVQNDPNARAWRSTFIQMFEAGQVDQNDELLASAYQKYKAEESQNPAMAQ